MENVTRSIFLPLFESGLCLLANPTCKQCDAQIRHPLLPWLVGPKFTDGADRILFVGKPHRGNPGTILQSGIIDPTNMVKDELWGYSAAYWSYTREIAERLYGSSATDHIALTNIIKCTNVDADDVEPDSTDKTTYCMAEQCIQGLGVIWKEVEILRPTSIIFYTYGLFRKMLQTVPVAFEGTVRELTDQNHAVPCRNKRLGWWERTCNTPWTKKLRILVVGHPERMGRPEYVELLTNWLLLGKH